jgi:predicted O-methyltransferase YrrM
MTTDEIYEAEKNRKPGEVLAHERGLYHAGVIALETQRTLDIGEHLRFIYDTALAINARTILDLGVRNGCATAVLLCAAQVTEGYVTSVDTDACTLARAHIYALGLPERWTFIQCGDLYFAKTFTGPVDLVLIDTSHTRAQTDAELRAFCPMVRAGGVVLLHDTMTYGAGVMAAVEAFLSERDDWNFENRPGCFGLGVMTRK